MPQPFIPEPIESMKARLPQALEKVWKFTFPMLDRPGLHREHLFDFYSGLRLLISRDLLLDETPEIHVSASWEDMNSKELYVIDYEVKEAYKALGGEGELELIGISHGGVPHWLVKNA